MVRRSVSAREVVRRNRWVTRRHAYKALKTNNKQPKEMFLRRTAYFFACRIVRRTVYMRREASLTPLPFLGVSSLMNCRAFGRGFFLA